MTTAQLFEHDTDDHVVEVPAKAAIEPQVSVQLVTPELAAEWLAANTRNRRLRNKLVDQYARDMVAGRWAANFEPVQIAESGVLLNGQHRLAAIVASDTTQQMLVVTGVAEDAQDTIDVGAKRTVHDQLGFRGFTNGTTLGATARLAMLLHTGKDYRPTQPEVLAMVNTDETLQWAVEEVLPTLPRVVQPAVLAYCYLRFHHVDPDAAKRFFEHLTTLDNLPAGSPILALHKRLTVGAPIPSTSRGRLFAVACFVQAWNAWRNDEERTIIRPRKRKDGDYSIPEPV